MEAQTPQEPGYTIRSRASADDARRAGLLATADRRHVYVLIYLLLAALGVALILFAGQVDVIVGATLVLVGSFSIFATYRPRASSTERELWQPDEFTFRFEEGGITTTAWFTSRSILWAGVTEVRSNKQTIVFMRGGSTFTWLPTSAFDSQAEIDAVLAFARAHVATAAANAAGRPENRS
jgi:hypothetical protein